jgi:hypothetical protein
VKATKREEALVLDGPLDGFAAREIHSLSESGREVDIPLFAGFAFDELDFGGETHESRLLSESSLLTRYHQTS